MDRRKRIEEKEEDGVRSCGGEEKLERRRMTKWSLPDH